MFQTFSCDHYPEIDEHRLRADGRIECRTATHKAYMVYAGIMVCLCELKTNKPFPDQNGYNEDTFHNIFHLRIYNATPLSRVINTYHPDADIEKPGTVYTTTPRLAWRRNHLTDQAKKMNPTILRTPPLERPSVLLISYLQMPGHRSRYF